MERLDRFLANPQWQLLFPSGGVFHGHAAYLDHYPIWLEISFPGKGYIGPRPFRFEAMWVGVEQCTKIIEDEWGIAGRQGVFSASDEFAL